MCNKKQLFKRILDDITDDNHTSLKKHVSIYCHHANNINEASMVLLRLFEISLGVKKYGSLLTLAEFNLSLIDFYPEESKQKVKYYLHSQKLFALIALEEHEEAKNYIEKLILDGQDTLTRLIESCIPYLKNYIDDSAADIATKIQYDILTRSAIAQASDAATDTALIGEPIIEDSKTPEYNV